MARIGEKWVWFDAKVINVKDPHKSGRVQIRVKGYHDDETKIPDKDLPWAQVLMPVTSASVNKVGGSPTGLLPNSRVIGFWYDANDMRIPFVIGSYVSAGELDNNGKTQGGKTPPKEKTNSGNPLNRPKGKDDAGGDRNPKPLPNAIEKNNDRKDDTSLEKKSITKVAAEGLKAPNLKTIGSLAGGLKKDVLNTISSIDPSNISGSIPKALTSLLKIDALSSLGNAAGIFNMASTALQGLMSQAINDKGGTQNAINNVLKTLLTFIESEEFEKLTEENKLIVLKAIEQLTNNPTTSPIDSTINSTQILSSLTNGISSSSNPSQVIDAVIKQGMNQISSSFLNILNGRNLTGNVMNTLIGNLNSTLSSTGLQAMLGSGLNVNNILSEATKLLGSTGSNMIKTVTSNLPSTVLDENKIKKPIEDALKNFARVKKKQEQNPMATSSSENKQNAITAINDSFAQLD